MIQEKVREENNNSNQKQIELNKTIQNKEYKEVDLSKLHNDILLSGLIVFILINFQCIFFNSI